MTTPRRTQALLLLPVLLAAGCRPEGANLSPTPAQDPARYARAVTEHKAAEEAAKAGEAGFFRRRRAAPDTIAEVDAKIDATSQSAPDTNNPTPQDNSR